MISVLVPFCDIVVLCVQETYGLSSLAPADWDNLVQRMVSNDTILQTFFRQVAPVEVHLSHL